MILKSSLANLYYYSQMHICKMVWDISSKGYKYYYNITIFLLLHFYTHTHTIGSYWSYLHHIYCLHSQLIMNSPHKTAAVGPILEFDESNCLCKRRRLQLSMETFVLWGFVSETTFRHHVMRQGGRLSPNLLVKLSISYL